MGVTQKELDKFEAWLLKYGRSVGSAKLYASNVRRALERGSFFSQLTRTDLSPKYLGLIKATAKAWCEYRDDEKLLKKIKRIKLPPSIRQEESIPLTGDELSILQKEIARADYLEEPIRAELGMLAYRGFRCGDVLRIKRAEVEYGIKTGQLNFTGKGRKPLLWSVGKTWRPYLKIFLNYKDWDQVCDLISPAAKRPAKAASATVAKALNVVTEKAGLDPESMHPHLLRHTYATLYYNKCKDPKKLQTHMGWADISTAMGYVHAGTREELDEIADSLFE